jgi:hypothetical protein
MPVGDANGYLVGFVSDGPLHSFIKESGVARVHYLAESADRPVGEVMSTEVSERVESQEQLMEVLHKSSGRPKVFDDGDLASATEALANGVPSGPKSRRQTQNRLYALRALERLGLLGDGELKQALADRPALRWLVDEDGARWGILAELGRIRDLEKFDAAVAWVLEHQPKTKEAVRRIRLFRTGRSSSPNARELTEEIVRAVNGYGSKYPELTCEQQLEALRLATETLAGGCGRR